MAYTALYRKLRPKSFQDVVGQSAIVKTLKNQIATKRISHAYLFCGTRGTGKTSTAKIFAKAINCEQPIDGEPCNQCAVCIEIETGRSMNVLEIDAASNNGVDNIREIRDEVRYTPTSGVYKVYLIDEVHMLSTGAFNALLKTLEEPPQYVIFILATTDPQKVLPTVLSRCQRFDFKRITEEDIVAKIKQYLQSDNIEADDEALRYISRISDGAMRDALSILDQCIAFYFDEKITLDNVLEIVGAVDNRVLFEMTDALIKCEVSECLRIIEHIILKGRDISQFVSEMIGHMRNVLVSKSDISALDLSAEDTREIKIQSEAVSNEMLIYYINELSELKGQLRFVGNGRVMLEVAVIKMCSILKESDESLKIRISKLEQYIEKGDFIKSVERTSTGETAQTEIKQKEKPKIKKAIPEDIKKVCNEWKSISNSFEALIKSLAQKVSPQYIDGETLCLICGDKSSADILKFRMDKIKQTLAERYEKDYTISIMTKEEFDSRHRSVYGCSEEEVEIVSENVFTDKINMDIIFEN